MSIISFLFKPKKEMAKKDTKRVKVGKYEVSSHAQNRVVDPKRSLQKKDMIINLLGKSTNSKDYKYKDGTLQYDRVNDNNRTITNIVKNKNIVKTIKKYHNNKKGKKDAYKNF